jgi:hypothetical protein
MAQSRRNGKGDAMRKSQAHKPLSLIPMSVAILIGTFLTTATWTLHAISAPVGELWDDGPAVAAPTRPDAMPQAQLSEMYGKLPLQFEPNRGQTDTQVKFLSRGQGYTLFLTLTLKLCSCWPSRRRARSETISRLSGPTW